MRTITAFDRMKEEASEGAIRERTLLEAMSESVNGLANALVEGAKQTTDQDAAVLMTGAEGILRVVASNLNLHSLTHRTDAPKPLGDLQAEVEGILGQAEPSPSTGKATGGAA